MYSLAQRNLDQDKKSKFDNSYIESAIFTLWKIDLINLIKTKAILAKNFHIQPSEIDKMQMWEYEMFIVQLNEIVEDENDQQKAQMDKYGVNNAMNMAKPGNIQKMQQNSMPKMPSMPNMNISMPSTKF